jgi:hypothetical protein
MLTWVKPVARMVSPGPYSGRTETVFQAE